MKGKLPIAQSEYNIQCSCVKWFKLKYKNYLIFSCPNESTRTNSKYINSGMLAGVSDLIILFNDKVIFVEMKTKTGTQRDTQKIFQKNVERLGFKYYICRSFEEFQEICNLESV